LFAVLLLLLLLLLPLLPRMTISCTSTMVTFCLMSVPTALQQANHHNVQEHCPLHNAAAPLELDVCKIGH
jgi:hypothetical protein